MKQIGSAGSQNAVTGHFEPDDTAVLILDEVPVLVQDNWLSVLRKPSLGSTVIDMARVSTFESIGTFKVDDPVTVSYMGQTREAVVKEIVPSMIRLTEILLIQWHSETSTT